MNISKINSLALSLRDAISALEWAKTFASQEDAKHAVDCYENMANDAIRIIKAVHSDLREAVLPSDPSREAWESGFRAGWDWQQNDCGIDNYPPLFERDSIFREMHHEREQPDRDVWEDGFMCGRNEQVESRFRKQGNIYPPCLTRDALFDKNYSITAKH